ncbi:MAG: hypothetical protein C5B52_18125 [Bacteroidetes bacterium]|nr:MAG: hypothetical protein C5B52_18125 [Bacteroidota bacterium]
MTSANAEIHINLIKAEYFINETEESCKENISVLTSGKYMLQKQFISHLEKELTKHFSDTVTISGHHSIHGGDINETYTLETNQAKYFLKVNDQKIGDDLFEKERKGLLLLRQADCIRTPLPLFNGKFEEKIFLLMEFISRGSPGKGMWNEFGESLATLHHQSAREFGLDHNNYLGSVPQSNHQHKTWAAFYGEERIMKLTAALRQMGLLELRYEKAAVHLCSRLIDIFPDEDPSLLHGDLWGGNFMVDDLGKAVIFDPAVYFGHREMDLAMCRLFGGFDQEFFEAYEYYYPLEKDYGKRVPVCQLYPLLIHLLLFGGHYHHDVIDILDPYQ